MTWWSRPPAGNDGLRAGVAFAPASKTCPLDSSILNRLLTSYGTGQSVSPQFQLPEPPASATIAVITHDRAAGLAANGISGAGSQPVIRGIIRRKLRVTLDPADGRREIRMAWDCSVTSGSSCCKRPGTDAIRNLRSYAAVIADHACSEYFRESIPPKGRIHVRRKVRHVMESIAVN